MMKLRGTGQEQKEAAVREWARRRLGSVAHELRVARVARMLFDLTRRWHGLGTAECRLLMMGALVHDVGRAEGEKKHAQRGAEMVMASRSLAVSEAERSRLAYLTRYHKGTVPEAGEALRDEPGGAENGSLTMRVVLGLLRAADGLDSRSLGGPRLVVTVGGSRRVLSIYGYVEGDAWEAEEVFGRRKKFRLLEETLHCEVETHWVGTEAFALVG